MIDEEFDQSVQLAQNEYYEFLDDEERDGLYNKRVREMVDENRIRLLVNLNDVRKFSETRADKLLNASAIEQIAFNNALKEYVISFSPSHSDQEFHVGFEGSFGSKHVSPRSLTSKFLNNMICLEGIVTECSLVRPKIVKSVHYCPATGSFLERKYADFTSLNPKFTSHFYPTQDADGNLLETEFGLSSYKDHQTLVIQEMPERAPSGQLPRAVEVICDDDLADKCKPGDRVQISGLYRCLAVSKGSYSTGVFRTVVVANYISHLNKELKLAMSRTDITNCRKVARKKNIIDLLCKSIAPTICGHHSIKQGILCMLLGGVEKILDNGTRLRGDINVLLIGDPSVAKSQLLRYVLCTAPRAIAATGRSSSGVGLTAAVTVNKETGERKLEAGAMVLADRGIVCIDEFDKMSDIDRTAIHEVMEQGRVTIAKAGIHTRLNARCSVLAAANPISGRYDRYKSPLENINLQDSLLSRFDLVYVMLDDVDEEKDEMISDHILRIHRYRNPLEQDGAVLPMEAGVEFLTTGNIGDMSDNNGPVTIFEKYDPLLHGANAAMQEDQVFTVKFLRMYIHLARTLKPVLSDSACQAISEEYARLRSEVAVEDGFARTQTVTPRTLESLIRLATAHAKARLSCLVEHNDAMEAIELVQMAYFKKVFQRKRSSRSKDDDDKDDASHTVDEMSETVETPAGNQDTNNGNNESDDDLYDDDNFRLVLSSSSDDDYDYEEEENELDGKEDLGERYDQFKNFASQIFESCNKQSVTIEFFRSEMTKISGSEFSKGVTKLAMERMVEENIIMMTDDMIYLI